MPFNLNNALGSLGALGQGYFSGQDAATERAMRLYQIQRQKDENQRIDADRAGMEDATAKLAQQLGPPPQQTPPPVAQAPSPGQSSQAMRPQQAPPQGLQLPPQFQVPGMQPFPQQGQMGPNPGLGAPGGQRPPMPPWTGYQSPQAQQQQGMPQGVPQPPPQSSQQQVPQQGYDLPTMVKTLVSQGVPAHYAFQVVQDRFVPMLSFEGKMQLQQAQQLLKQRQLENKDAEFNARESRLRAQFGLDENGNPTMAPGTRSAVNAGTVKVDDAKAKKLAGQAGNAGGGATPAKSDLAEFYLAQEVGGNHEWKTRMPQKEVASIMNRLPEYAKTHGIEPQELGTASATRKALTTTLRNVSNRSTAVELFSDKLAKDMASLDGLLDKAAPTGPLFINKPLNALRRQFNDPDLAQLDLQARQVGTEYERLITSGGLSQAQLHRGAQEDAKGLISGDFPPQKTRAVMKQIKIDIENARSAAKSTQQAIMEQLTGLGQGGSAKPAASSDKVVDFSTLK